MTRRARLDPAIEAFFAVGDWVASRSPPGSALALHITADEAAANRALRGLVLRAVFAVRWGLEGGVRRATEPFDIRPSFAQMEVLALLAAAGAELSDLVSLLAPVEHSKFVAAAGDELGRLYEELLTHGLQAVSTTRLWSKRYRRLLDPAVLAEAPPHARSRLAGVALDAPLSKRLSTCLSEAPADELAAVARRELDAHDVEPGSVVFSRGSDRRRGGAHFTPAEIAARVTSLALTPLVDDGVMADALTICDPAMGGGSFLLRALDFLMRAGVRRERAVTQLYGVDTDALAVDLARAVLWEQAGGPQTAAPPQIFRQLVVGNALVGVLSSDLEEGAPRPGDAVFERYADHLVRAHFASDERSWDVARDGLEPALRAWGPFPLAMAAGTEPEPARPMDTAKPPVCPLHWEAAFPGVFREGGFYAIIGNPPWVAYAGRAAQPLLPAHHAYYLRFYRGFHGYRTLQGLFVERASRLLRAGGRLGLVVPTSLSDLSGYAPTRQAHDRHCDADDGLVEFGAHAFAGVFQPAMALTSTKRTAACEPGTEPWNIARDDLTASAKQLLDRLASRPTLPPHLFGERGYQSQGADKTHFLAAADHAHDRHLVTIREGADVRPWVLGPPRVRVDPRKLAAAWRPADQWRAVRLFIRQTARVPVVAMSDGSAFRNSILAGFDDAEYPAHGLLAYLNSTAVRWFHYCYQRDARQGMPQVKIAHLRRLPAPKPGTMQLLAATAKELGGAPPDEAGALALDAIVLDGLDVTAAERAVLEEWKPRLPSY